MVKYKSQEAFYYGKKRDVAEVPDEFDASNMEIKDSNGSTLGVTSIKKDRKNGYYVALSSNMVDGKYTLTMHLNGKKYVKGFTYDSKILSEIKAQAAKMIAESTENEVVASVSALETPVLFEDALVDFLDAKFKNDDYEVVYQNLLSRTDNKATAKMGINLYYYNEDTQTNTCYESLCDVTFSCTGDKFIISFPEIAGVLKNSVVIKSKRDYQYACVKEDSGIELKDIDDWVSDNWNSYFEIGNLEANTTYRLYCIYDESTTLSAYKTFSTGDEGVEEAICIADAREGSKTEFNMNTLSAGAMILFPVEVDDYEFGNIDPKGLHGDMEFVCEDTELNESLYDEEWNMQEWDEVRKCPRITFTVPSGLATGNYTVKINYRYVCNAIDENGKWTNNIIARSKPITYTIHFSVRGVFYSPICCATKCKFNFCNWVFYRAAKFGYVHKLSGYVHIIQNLDCSYML